VSIWKKNFDGDDYVVFASEDTTKLSQIYDRMVEMRGYMQDPDTAKLDILEAICRAEVERKWEPQQ
jgi:hypothetical protein